VTKMKWFEQSEITGVTATNLKNLTQATPEAKVEKKT
jgi:hypothetical protein